MNTFADSPSVHVSVLPKEVVHWLAPRSGSVLVDGTLGGGGHTRLLAGLVGETGCVIALDRDPRAILAAEKSFVGLPVRLVNANFCDLPDVLAELGISGVDGVVLDLGLSSDQLADGERGFSFDSEGELDLRFNPNEGEPAWRMVHRMRAEPLADLIYEYGEERCSRRIARAIVEEREREPIRTAARMAAIVRRCVPRGGNDRIDPATRTFQALRIAVNEELQSLEKALQRMPDCLTAGGRMAIISFHSLEDRRVKHSFREDVRLQVLTKKPILPTPGEAYVNPRSRSAKLRVAERVANADVSGKQR